MSPAKPPLFARIALLGLLGGFAALARNPIVLLEARLGLSPSPLERLFGIRGFFSGMTEAAHRLSRFDFVGAAQANVLVFPTIAAFTLVLLTWRAPKLRTRAQELGFFGLIVAGTALNNAVPAWIAA